MNKMNFARLASRLIVAAGLALLQLASAGSAFAAANCIKGEHKPPYKIGWANIYSIPTWMKETTGTIEDMANVLKKQGLVDSLTITDAQGNANTQIQQIQSMIDAKLDAIIVDAGSATALDRVIADACSKGIAVTNFDSLVDTKDLTTKIDTDQNQWGKLAAEWLVKQLNGKGNILVLNGPAGVSVSDDGARARSPCSRPIRASRFWRRPTRPTTPRPRRKPSPTCSSAIPRSTGSGARAARSRPER